MGPSGRVRSARSRLAAPSKPTRRASIETLFSMLEDEDREKRWAARQELVPRHALYSKENEDVVKEYVNAREIESIVWRLTSNFFGACLDALVRLDDPRTEEPLIRLLQDRPDFVRHRVLEYSELWNDPFVNDLGKYIDWAAADYYRVQMKGIEILRRIATPGANRYLETLDQTDPAINAPPPPSQPS